MMGVYYKVVRKYHGELVSARVWYRVPSIPKEIDDNLLLRYKIGEVTYPNIGYIFAFDSLLNAKNFVSYNKDTKLFIYSCVGKKNRIKLRGVTCSSSLRKMKWLWETPIQKLKGPFISNFPSGTVLLKHCKLIEEIKNEKASKI
jgi:hypothetical protein